MELQGSEPAKGTEGRVMNEPCDKELQGRHTEQLAEHEKQLKKLDEKEDAQWRVIDQLRNRLPLWMTIVLATLSSVTAHFYTKYESTKAVDMKVEIALTKVEMRIDQLEKALARR